MKQRQMNTEVDVKSAPNLHQSKMYTDVAKVG